MPPDVFVFSLTSVRCPVALCAPYCERVRIHSHNGRYRGIAPRAERHPARHCRLSGVRSPVAVSYRHMYATGVVHTVLGWYAVRARSVISYSTTIRPSTAYNVLQYLHEDRRPGPDSRRDTSVLRSRERLDHFTFRWFRLFKRLPTTRAQICTDGPLAQAFHVKAVPTH